MVAMSSDVLSIACSEIGSIAERRIALLIDKNLSRLPSFLVNDAGLNSGFMIGHVTAASLASENKTLSHPASVDSIPTSANQEDHVSMATFAANKMNKIADNVLFILAIETFAACQGVSFRLPLKTSTILLSKFSAIRKKVPFYDTDRYFSGDIHTIRDIISTIPYYVDVEDMLF
jgi:histidine ammonia-lyase